VWRGFYSEMVDFGSGQGRSDIETAGVAALRRGFQRSENAGLDQKVPFLDGQLLRRTGKRHNGQLKQRGKL
jgi:hypothetical protein